MQSTASHEIQAAVALERKYGPRRLNLLLYTYGARSACRNARSQPLSFISHPKKEPCPV